MVNIVNIEGHQVEVDTSAGWFYEYLEQFGHDIMSDIMPIVESVMSAAVSVLQESGGTFTEKDVLSAMNNDALIDAFIKMSGMESITVLNIFWAMAKNRNPNIDSPKQFFRNLERFPWDTMSIQLLRMIVDSSVSSKNAKSLLERIDRMMEKVNGKQASTPSPSQESTEG